ncbi:MAG: hypothetical protein WC107_05670 [Patescibacteria group bacterium]|jgi:hypothetical protein
MNPELVIIAREYIGTCHNCQSEIKFDRLLLADTLELDEFNNKIFYCIGVPDYEGTTAGKRAICDNCGVTLNLVRIYEKQNIAKEVTEWLNHSCQS